MKGFTNYSLLLALLYLASSCSRETGAPPIPMTFNKSSEELKATVVLSTLDAPIPEGKNAIWCASFQAAWKALVELAGGAITFDEPSITAGSFNEGADPRLHIPPASLYVAAGWNQKAITKKIYSDLKERFPNKAPPSFPGILPTSFVAYAYLEAKVKFSRSYYQNKRPLVFAEANGRKVEVHSFGILPENHDARDKLWQQPRILFRKGEPREESFEFAIDLCSNSFPSQIVVARIAREPTLAAAVGRVEREIAEMPRVVELEAASSSRYSAEGLYRIQSTDALLVPDFHWAICHRFSQLEGNRFANTQLQGQRLDVAQQDILFRLDKSGAELKSEVKGYAAGIPAEFFCDRPFLVYMKKRGGEMPYFALWIDNAELMRPWQGAPDGVPVNESATQ